MSNNRLLSLSLHLSSPPSPDNAEPGEGTPLIRFVNSTLDSNIYQTVCLPITNSKWAERWKRMCLSTSHTEEKDLDEELFDMVDEDAEEATAKISDHAGQGGLTKDAETQRVAESWRAGTSGRFQRDEVNLTKIGAFCGKLNFSFKTLTRDIIQPLLSSDEAECTIGMAADWLELDSPDIWVRHDSELVSISPLQQI